MSRSAHDHNEKETSTDRGPGTFLDPAELKRFTGRTYVKLQIEALRQMGVPFFVNGVGRPVVARAVIEGRAGAIATPPKKAWQPKVLRAG